MAEFQYINDYITYESNVCLAKSSPCCWLWRSKLLYVVSCLWRGPCKNLRKASSWQPAGNWGPYGDSLILPQLNLWDSSHGQHLDCSLTDDPLQPQVFSNVVAWGVHGNPLCTHKCTSPNCRGVNACGTTVEHWSMEDMDTYFCPSSLGNAFHKVPQEV